MAEQEGCPIFSASSLRYYNGIKGVVKPDQVASVTAFGPVEILDDYPGYYWYGVHVASIIYEMMGVGCIDVRVASSTELADTIVATWEDDRTANLIGYRFIGGHKWGATAFLNNDVIQTIALESPPGYSLLLKDVMHFFKKKKSPIDIEEMKEIMAFLEAINISLESNKKVELSSIM